MHVAVLIVDYGYVPLNKEEDVTEAAMLPLCWKLILQGLTDWDTATICADCLTCS